MKTVYTIVEYETIDNGIKRTRTRFMPIGVAEIDRNGCAIVRLKANGTVSIDLVMAKDS